MKEYNTLRLLLKKLNEQPFIKNYHKVGAIVLDKKGNVLSVGFSSYTKSHPRQYFYNKKINPNKIYLHAEVDALIKCKGEPHTMIIGRVGRDGLVHIARPCKGCYNAIKDVKVKKVYFTNNYGELTLLDTDVKLEDYYDHHSFDE